MNPPEPRPGVSTAPEYGEIRVLDNPTPGWWHALFLCTVVCGIVYFVFKQFSPEATTAQDEYAMVRYRELKRQFVELGELRADAPTMLRLMRDEKWMGYAAAAFKANCAACHGPDAEGEIGPNLTDDAYKNVKSLADIPAVIATGANGGAMPAWKGRLDSNEIVLLASYVAWLRGKNLPGPRGAEGEVIPPWPGAAATELDGSHTPK